MNPKLTTIEYVIGMHQVLAVYDVDENTKPEEATKIIALVVLSPLGNAIYFFKSRNKDKQLIKEVVQQEICSGFSIKFEYEIELEKQKMPFCDVKLFLLRIPSPISGNIIDVNGIENNDSSNQRVIYIRAFNERIKKLIKDIFIQETKLEGWVED